jgi:uncharacterized protein YfaS (alpha-2-macroglobulin family)
VPIGTVQAFRTSEVSAENNRIEGRRLIVEFNKPVGEEVTAESLGKWITIQPAVANLKPVVDDTTIRFKGDFALGVPYRLTVAPGFPAREPTATTAPLTSEVVFKRVDPRLYFSDFSTHQYTGGTRELRLVSVNVPRIRVTAHLFTGEAIPTALSGYDKYQEHTDELEPDESYSRVNVEELPGREVWSREIAADQPIDQESTATVHWNEIVGENRTGVVIVTAESLDPMSAGGKRVGTQTLIQLTDLGAVWKRDSERTSLHVFSLASGKGIAAARVRLLDKEGIELAQGVTDASGDAQLPQNTETRWIAAERDADTHLIPIANHENELPLYRLGVTQDYTYPGDDGRFANTIFVFTERGVYRPGDIVYVKGYAQDARSDRPRIPAGKPVTITITDAKDRQISTTNLTLSDYGSFDGQITLPQGTLGRYRLQVTGEKDERLGGACFFQVQEYKPNAFEVTSPLHRKRRAASSCRCRSRRNTSWVSRSRKRSSAGRWSRATLASRRKDSAGMRSATRSTISG